MANGDLDVLKQTIMSMRAAKGCYSIGFGHQPGLVVVALVSRESPTATKITGMDIPIPVDQIDGVIERLQRAKANALRKSQ